ncbi:MAG: 50S ribosome-binding GTPase [Bacteroidales bacterium]|nr:50S ribosome-binding GTPase [Bacteroidales bacterium]
MNVGKSTLVNLLTGQQIAIVNDTAGTTTDPVRKSMEIGGIGPVVLIDTAGLDDEGTLGRQRVEKSMAVLAEVDLALLLYTEGCYGEPEERVERWCTEHGTPMLKVMTKAAPIDKEGLIEQIKKALPESAYRTRSLLGDVVGAGDTVVMVTPIDSSAPEGRMILPQVQVLRDLMDIHATAYFCQPQELATALTSLKGRPRLVITDSQAFKQVATVVPDEVDLTSFSIVLARQKGLFREYLAGTRTIGSLEDGDRVLLLESCTHNVTCEDIGRVKLPAALKKATGKQLEFEIIGGASTATHYPLSTNHYKLVIQCGGCVITAQQVKARLLPALEAGVPVSNYGLALAWCNGIFDRATRLFS